ncbi:hypothetical protein PVAND_003607 [Polypedilum vanderplanki]|uniref:Heat shock protein 83 n=1 Tax=Polypedilum vanderplanki TaxID=319348 RepID=A0A9J6BUJ6_POLVA|nr:hypothetical protein PVAND_003607 [Polypedilum vanderplanki]
MKYLLATTLGIVLLISTGILVSGSKDQDGVDDVKIDATLKTSTGTDSETLKREEESINIDGLSQKELKDLRDKAEKHTFQAEVNRMMKLIINSLYKNKEIFLRELISNASDALDKIRLMSLTDRAQLETNTDLIIRVKTDKENRVLHIIDTGIGMTHDDLINNLGTIAKSGTADFLSKVQENENGQDANDMIGQFGVGFYSAFLVADKVVVTTKHNDDEQYIWESDSANFNIVKDPRGSTLKRGSQISLYLKEEAQDFLEEDTIKQLIKKYSQFINFPIYMWTSKTVEEEVPIEEEIEKKEAEDETDDDEAKVEEEAPEEKTPKTKKQTKTVWDWELMNDSKPIWTRKPADVTQDEYDAFYKSLTKDTSEPLTQTHFVAEGEVTFKSLLFVPKIQPSESFNKYGSKSDNIKLYVRRVFITDEFNDLMPNYLGFIRGVVDSDDLPLNVSRETLQQHKLIKVIKKKLVRKALDMLKKLEGEEYDKFWKEYSTNIKLGVMEDSSNRARLAKLLKFQSSNTKSGKLTSLSDYSSRMKPKQEWIYYIAAASRAEAEKSPFIERLVARGYEVLFLVEAVDEYCISALPEFDGKKFQNVAKEGFSLPESEEAKEKFEELKNKFEPLAKWFADVGLKDKITKAMVSEKLTNTPCVLVASMFGWTGNMERLAMSNAHKKAEDVSQSYYFNQKKALEFNPRHPVIKDLLRKIDADPQDPSAKEMAELLLDTAVLRSGFMLTETRKFADSIDKLMRQAMNLQDAEFDPEIEEFPEPSNTDEPQTDADEEEIDGDLEEHDEL